ncbi:MAG: leucine--tRNA ligase [Candidatus Levybacteria bacterium]|nr:leucine--tRNA ligase [Candidatus Levybacteria bacterium]
MEKYNPSSIEKKWQDVWEKQGLYKAKDFDARKKFYTLIEFPYPSGAGLHVGHVRSWSAMDAYSRKKRMEGFNVLYPIGWDAFGLPAENYAIKNKIHPSIAVEKNIETFKRQVKSLGLSFDWSREVNTTDPKYYKWTQWIFLKFFEKGLAFQADVPVNWCPSCKTNLADEEVQPDGTHERCGNPTEKRMQKQWLLKITAYADKLLEDLKLVDYSNKIAVQQVNWIGKSEGVMFRYKVKDMNIHFEMFDTVPQTFMAQTFTVIAPEHPKVYELVKGTEHEKPVMEFVEKIKQKKARKKFDIEKEKEGIFTGRYTEYTPNGKLLPIWVASFVIYEYGTGVVNASVHDERDFAFAKKYNLPLHPVMFPKDPELAEKVKNLEVCYHHEPDGILQEPEEFKGMRWQDARGPIIKYIEQKGFGKRSSQFHLRDWVFSRQHYWGEPIPIIYCRKCWEFKVQSSRLAAKRAKFKVEGRDYRVIDGEEYAIVPVPEKDLPVELPYLEQYEPSGTGESPLAKVTEWVNVACPECGGAARRETDTMPNWAGSNWYFLAYLFASKLDQKSLKFNPSASLRSSTPRSLRRSSRGLSPEGLEEARVQNSKLIKEDNIFEENKDVIKYWMPVDIYQGGFEHTTLHLLYSRFVYKFLYDIGVVPTPEPYAKRRSHGIVLGPDGRKMSKSFGNVINPDDIAGKFGADTLRVYEMFMGPFDQTIAWSEESVEGCFRFLKRVWQLSLTKVSDSKTSAQLLTSLHKAIKKVGEDLENMKFNTAVAAMMEFINSWQADAQGLSKEDLEKFLLILAPFAPHVTEELWQRIKNNESGPSISSSGSREIMNNGENHNSSFIIHNSIHSRSWPSYDPNLLVEGEITIAVQVNGKVRDSINKS